MRNKTITDLRAQVVDVVDGKNSAESLRSRTFHCYTIALPREWVSRVILIQDKKDLGDT